MSQDGRRSRLAHTAQLIHGPVSEYGLAVDVALIHRTEITAVVRHRPVISQHEVAIRWDHCFRIRPRVGVGGRNVIFIERLAVHVDLAPVDTDAVAGHADYALDITF